HLAGKRAIRGDESLLPVRLDNDLLRRERNREVVLRAGRLPRGSRGPGRATHDQAEAQQQAVEFGEPITLRCVRFFHSHHRCSWGAGPWSSPHSGWHGPIRGTGPTHRIPGRTTWPNLPTAHGSTGHAEE